MKKALLLALVAAMLLTVGLTGCVVIKEDTGSQETRTYDYTGFTGVDIGSAFDYEIVQSDIYSVSVTADSDLFKYMEVEVVGDTLQINAEEFGWPRIVWEPTRMKVRITMPHLTDLEISGASDGRVTGFSSADELELNLSGASSLKMQDMTIGGLDMEMSGASDADMNMAVGGDVSFDISGASDFDGEMTVDGGMELEMSGSSSLELLGSARSIWLDASGASSLDLENFTVHDADVEMSGASSGSINLDGRLDVDLSGASYLEYNGDPQLGDFEVSGGSELERKDD